MLETGRGPRGRHINVPLLFHSRRVSARQRSKAPPRFRHDSTRLAREQRSRGVLRGKAPQSDGVCVLVACLHGRAACWGRYLEGRLEPKFISKVFQSDEDESAHVPPSLQPPTHFWTRITSQLLLYYTSLPGHKPRNGTIHLTTGSQANKRYRTPHYRKTPPPPQPS